MFKRPRYKYMRTLQIYEHGLMDSVIRNVEKFIPNYSNLCVSICVSASRNLQT